MPEHTIAENLVRLQAAKTAIGNAIVAKGGTVNSGDGLEEYPADIASIETAELTSISITENGVYSSGDAEEVESSNLPIVIEADGTPLLDYLISGNMSQAGTPTPASPIQPSECGELETIGVKAGQYKIPISSANTTTPIYLGEVETTRKIKKLVLTGEETYTYESAYSRFIISLPNAKIEGLRLTQVYCTHFISVYDGRSQSELPNNSIYSSDVLADRFFIKTTDYTTATDFKAYIAQQYANGTPVTIWYVLAEPETGIVNEPLRKIGNYADTLSMEQAGVQIPTNTSPSTTTIDIPTTLPPSLLYVEYNTLSTTSGYNIVDVNVPNTYSSSDEGKVVSNRRLIPQTAKPDTIIANNTYDTTNYNSVTVDVENSYSASDEGKVVDNGALVSQTAKPTEITVNDTYDTTLYNSVTVDVPNTYTQSDEGKVVSNGSLVAQTAKPTEITVNDTYDTTMYNSVTVDVANTYTQSDEGKVVNNGALVPQTTKPDVIVENGAYDTTLYNSVNVNVSSEPQERKDVNFYDYDGTIVKSYTAAEFADISELPDNPSHEGLTAQGWNWSLADAKAYVAKYGKLEIGQMYITDDGKTRIYITLTEGRTSPTLQLYLNPNSELDVDWGDGSSHSTFLAISAKYVMEVHDYATAGSYVIAIAVRTGRFVLQSSSTNVSSILWNRNDNSTSPDAAYNNAIKKIEIGTGTSIGDYAFFCCYSLSSVTIPDSVTSIGGYAFRSCFSLSSITLPDSVTTIGSEAFRSCSSLSSVTMGNSFLSINLHTFQSCSSLSSVTIPDSVTTISNQAFYQCVVLSSITLPDSVTTIRSEAFSYCRSVPSITIPDSVTSISESVFYFWLSLSSVTIPDSVTSINSNAFKNCSSMGSIKFTSTTPPTVASSAVWDDVPTDCKIYVPSGRLNTYKTATNYPSPYLYTYVEY